VLVGADAGIPTTGLVLWLRADVGVATLDGGAVCRWEDVSGNGRHFVPDLRLPQLVANQADGGPAVVFSLATWLQRTDVLGLGPASGRTVAARTQVADTAGRFESFHQGDGASNWQYFGLDQNTFNTAGHREGVYATACAFDSDVATSGAWRTHVYSISSMVVGTALPGALTYSVDGAPRTLTRTPGGSGNNTVWDFSGATFTWLGLTRPPFGTGAIGELLVYDHALTPAERTAVEGWLHR
jgi:hypothetical protein